MAKTGRIEWDRVGEHYYETGVDHGVFYERETDGSYTNGEAWNGLTAVNETPSGAEATGIYADNMKYLNLVSKEEFAATIEAYTYPPKFAECDGSATVVKGVTIGQQPRKTFGFSYRTKIGNDVDNDAHGYKLHMIYGCLASPSERAYGTVSDSPEAINFSWEVNTTPINVEGHQPTSIMIIDSTEVDADKLKELEDILYGTDETVARMPLPAEVIALFEEEEIVD